MDHGGANDGVRFCLVPSLPPTPATPFNGSSSLTVLHLYSFRLQEDYDDFLSELRSRLLSESTPNDAYKETIDAALKVLQMEAETEKAMVVAVAADRDEAGDHTDAMAVDAGAQLQAPVDPAENALKILMANATEEFGFAPRDVYNGIVDLPNIKHEHDLAMKDLEYSKLMTLSKTFHEKCKLDKFSHHIIAVSPCRFTVSRDRWTINFKSTRIAREWCYRCGC